MFKFKTLQSRLLIAFSGLSLVICFFFIRFSSVLITTAEINAYQSILAQEEARLVNANAKIDLATTPLVVIYKDMNAVPADIKINIDSRPHGDFTTDNEQHYVFRKIKANELDYLLVMNLNAFSANQYLSQYKSIFLFSISISAVILCLLSAWYLSKLLSRPIELLIQDISDKRSTGTITHLSDENRLSIYGSERDDEIGNLANELEASYKEIRTLLNREQNFTRDVSHELRTPITLIKNTLTIKKVKEFEADDFALLQQASNELENTVEILLALARQENLGFSSIRLLPIVEKAILNVYQIYPQFDLNIEVQIDSAMTAQGNSLLASLLVQNLINNCVHHGDSKNMRVFQLEKALVFENSVGNSEQSLNFNGFGHGQYLVQRIANQMQWGISKEQSKNYYKVIINTL